MLAAGHRGLLSASVLFKLLVVFSWGMILQAARAHIENDFGVEECHVWLSHNLLFFFEHLWLLLQLLLFWDRLSRCAFVVLMTVFGWN